MKNYSVVFATPEEVLSDFSIHANNLKEAKQTAQFHKRHLDPDHRGKRPKTFVKYLKK